MFYTKPCNPQIGCDPISLLNILDNDGLIDCQVGDYVGNIMWFKNTGTSNSPSFKLQNGAGGESPDPWLVGTTGVPYDVGTRAAPACFPSIYGEKEETDCVVAVQGTTLSFFRNENRRRGAAQLAMKLKSGTEDPFNGLKYAAEELNPAGSPWCYDVDNDGDIGDLIIPNRIIRF